MISARRAETTRNHPTGSLRALGNTGSSAWIISDLLATSIRPCPQYPASQLSPGWPFLTGIPGPQGNFDDACR